ncbi:MAG: AAA family ATPase [Lachnospiraceae bacterium]
MKEIEERLKALPKGTLVYKNIKGKQQPYLQRTEKGKSISVYVKKEGREQILALIEERKRLQEELEYLHTYQERIALILMNNPYLANKPGIGYQQFDTFIEGNMMYVDKTHFIIEWWESDVQITLINRPRRFGKTLMLSTVECFLSTRYKNREDLFEKLNIWKWEKYRRLQGTRPVIFMTFAAVKSNNLKGAVYSICEYLFYLYNTHSYLLEEDILSTEDKDLYQKTVEGLKNREPDVCKNALLILCYLLYQFYFEKVVILLDEYDTPLQEAYLAGYWGEMTDFIRALFNSTFKSNQYLDKALMTGITRVAKESLFSDINNLRIYTTTSKQYADVFGYTRQEVEDSLQCQNIEELETVKEWYDGYTFGGITDMYNPWAINCYISSRECQLFWANTGGYSLASRLIMNGSNRIKEEFEILLRGDKIHKVLDENVTFDELDYNQNAIWSLLLAAGYLKADNVRFDGMTECDLSITNKETKVLFQKMVTQKG